MGGRPTAGGWLEKLGARARAVLGAAARAGTASEDQFRQVAEASLQGIVIHDGRRRLFVNDAFARMFGYPDVATALAPGDFDDLILPEDRPALEAEWARLLAGRQTWSRARHRRRRLDGSIAWVELSLGPIVWNGEPAIHGIQIDVTREVEAEAALQRSEARFRTLIQESLQGILIHDGRQRLFANEAYAHMMGYATIEAALADPVTGHLLPEDLARVTAEWQRTLDGEETLTRRRLRRRRVDGHMIWLDLIRGPVNWAGRSAIQVTAIDVTREVEAETELRRNEARFRAVIDNLPLVLTLKDPDGRYRIVNREFEHWYGIAAASAIGKHPDELFDPAVNMPMTRPQVRIDDREVLTSGMPVMREHNRTDVTGRRRDVLVTKFPVRDATGAIDGIGTIVADVSELKRAQTELERREAGLERNHTTVLQVLRDELSAGSFADRLRRILQIAGETLGVDVVAVWRLDRPAGVVRCLERWRSPAMTDPGIVFPIEIARTDAEPLYRALEEHLVLALREERIRTDLPALHALYFAPLGLKSSLSTLIHVPESELVHIGFCKADPSHDWSTEDMAFARSIAELIRVCFFQEVHARRERELRRNQAAILQVLRDELTEGSVPDRIRRIIRLAGETLGVRSVGVWRIDEDETTVRCVARWRAGDDGYGATAFPDAIPFADGAALFTALREQFVLAVPDTSQDPRYDKFLRHYGTVGLSASLMAILRLPGGMRGHIGFGHAEGPRTWSVEDQSFVGSIAELIGACFLRDALERREAELGRNQAAILRILHDRLSGGSLDRIRNMLAVAGETLGVDAAALWQIDPEAGVSRCIYRWLSPSVSHPPSAFPTSVPLADLSEFHNTLARQLVLAFDDHGADRRFADFLQGHFGQVNISASLASMIQLPGGKQAYLGCSNYGATRSWSVEDQSFARSVAELIGVCFFQDELERREQSLQRNQDILVRIVREGLLAGGTSQEILDAIVRIACATLGLVRVGVWTCGEPVAESDRVCAAMWDDRLRRHIPPEEVAPISGANLAEWFTIDYMQQLQHDLLVAIEDVYHDPRMSEAGRAYCRAGGTGARMNALVRLPDRVIGVVTFLAGPGPRRWSAEDQAFARSVADLVAFAFLSERHRQSLAALDLVGQGLYVEDERGEVIYANQVARRLAGASSDGVIRLDALPAPLPGDGGDGSAAAEIVWRTPAGATLELAVARTASPSAGAITVIADITERNQRERERRTLEAEMRQTAKLEAVGRLASGIAHDFNNLLGTILGFASFLREDLDADTAQHGYASRIVKASEHAKDVVKQLLAFTRATDVERAAADLGTLVKDSGQLLRAAMPSSTHLVIDIGPRPLPVLVNNGQIHQILLNLCINANDALDGQPGTVALKLARVEPDGRGHGMPEQRDGVALVVGGQLKTDRAYARLTISDDGTGIDPTVLARVFEPFFTTKSPSRGTGLGLAVVHGIVTAYEGAYAVESEPGHGTIFSIYLPLQDERREERVIETGEVWAPQRMRGGEAVMVVDDETDLLEMMRIGLGRLGYSVTGYADPMRALEAFERNPEGWDIVVTDQVMPGLKGSALIAKLHEIRPQCPVILCTGFSDGATERQATKVGAAGFFLKPVEPYRVAEKIRALLDG